MYPLNLLFVSGNPCLYFHTAIYTDERKHVSSPKSVVFLNWLKILLPGSGVESPQLPDGAIKN